MKSFLISLLLVNCLFGLLNAESASTQPEITCPTAKQNYLSNAACVIASKGGRQCLPLANLYDNVPIQSTTLNNGESMKVSIYDCDSEINDFSRCHRVSNPDQYWSLTFNENDISAGETFCFSTSGCVGTPLRNCIRYFRVSYDIDFDFVLTRDVKNICSKNISASIAVVGNSRVLGGKASQCSFDSNKCDWDYDNVDIGQDIGTCDDGTPTSDYSAWRCDRVASVSPHGGNNYFIGTVSGGAAASTAVYQSMPEELKRFILAPNSPAPSINTNRGITNPIVLFFDVVGYVDYTGDHQAGCPVPLHLQLFSRSVKSASGFYDSIQIYIQAVDTYHNRLYFNVTGYSSPDTWSRFDLYFTVPSTVTTVEVYFVCIQKNDGSDCNAFVDDVTLKPLASADIGKFSSSWSQ